MLEMNWDGADMIVEWADEDYPHTDVAAGLIDPNVDTVWRDGVTGLVYVA